MTASVAVFGGVAVLVAAAWMPALVRERVRAPAADRLARAHPRSEARHGWPWSPARSLGRLMRSTARRPADPGADRFVGRVAVAAALVAFMVSPLLAGVVIWACVGWRWWSRRARQRGRARAGIDGLPDLVDLVRVAVSAGCTPPGAVRAVAASAPQPLREALQATLDAHRRGASLADAMHQLPGVLGEAARPLATGLARTLRDGTPVLATLERLSLEARRARRRQAEVRARRLPVLLLFPLVLCTLPAFALLTVVPLLLTSLQHLQL